jgi:hypothetical protein
MTVISLGQPITLGQTITDVFTGYTPLSQTNSSPTSYTDYILPILPNFEQIQIILDPKDNAILDGTTLSIYNVATNNILARITASVSGSATAINNPVSLYQTIYPGITYGIEVYNSSVSNANLAGILPGTYSLSLTDRGQATSIVSASTYKLLNVFGNERYSSQVGTVNAAGKYSTLARGNIIPDDVALSPSGLFYGIKSSSGTSSADQLWVVDPSLAEGSQIGNGANLKDTSGNNLFKSLNSLAFSSNNQLYAIGRNAAGVSEFYQIDVNTKIATLLSTLPAGLSTKFGSFAPFGGDLVYDVANNRFLVTSDSTSTNALWQIPLANPSGATKIGNIGFYNVAGLSFENGQLTGFIGDASYGTEGKVVINTSTGVGTLDPAFSTVNAVIFTGATSILPLAKNTRNDFNGDSKSDILWQNTDGSIAEWQMNSLTATPSAIGALPSGWTTAGTGDFNGDSKADILLRNTVNGSVAQWQMNGSTVTTATTIGTLTSGWSISGTGDFNGDGSSDVLLTNTNGTIAQWQMNNGTVTTAKTIGTLSAGWSIAGTADFNGDGKTDILLKNTNGSIAQWQMDGGAVLAASVIGAVTPDWTIAATGDFNGDGKADLLFRNANGSVAEWQMNGSTVTNTAIVGTSTADWKITGTGDYNGDGRADILWRNDSGSIAEWQMNGSALLSAGATSIPSAAASWTIAAPIG